jgi:hypothetical protein
MCFVKGAEEIFRVSRWEVIAELRKMHNKDLRSITLQSLSRRTKGVDV